MHTIICTTIPQILSFDVRHGLPQTLNLPPQAFLRSMGRGMMVREVLVRSGLPFSYFIPDISLPWNARFIIVETQGISIAAGYVPPNVSLSFNQWSKIVSLISPPFLLLSLNYLLNYQSTMNYKSIKTKLKIARTLFKHEISKTINFLKLTQIRTFVLLSTLLQIRRFQLSITKFF